MCGILALLLADTTAHCRQALFDGLTVLQHRGQDAAGIVTANTSKGSTKFQLHKGMGLVNNVFQTEDMAKLEGNVGIAHVRYPTAGSSCTDEVQPMYTNYPCGLALGHNGNLTNRAEQMELLLDSHRHLNTESDTEVLLNVLADELSKELAKIPRDPAVTRPSIEPEAIFAAVRETMKRLRGGYAVVVLIHDVGVIAFRDQWGIRPLSYGERPSSTIPGGVDYVMSSETVAMDTLGFSVTRDIRPGECVLALPMDPENPREDRGLLTQQLVGDGSMAASTPCLFEYVYFARPDSVMNNVSVYASRLNMGTKLAERIKAVYPNHDIDVVVPVPDTSRTSALQCAQTLGRPYREGFIKNRYIGRTFIMPGQAMRKKSVRLKLNTIRAEFEGKNVLLVDDSIVRGTTSMELVEMARDAGAKRVYFVSAAPEVRFPNVYGIDLPCSSELIANNRTTEEIATKIRADWVLYQTLPDLEDAVRSLNPEIRNFETSTFSGTYVTNDVDEKYLDSLAGNRSDDVKEARKAEVERKLSTPQ